MVVLGRDRMEVAVHRHASAVTRRCTCVRFKTTGFWTLPRGTGQVCVCRLWGGSSGGRQAGGRVRSVMFVFVFVDLPASAWPGGAGRRRLLLAARAPFFRPTTTTTTPHTNPPDCIQQQ